MVEINIDPVAFSIGPIEVRWYAIMVALAIVISSLVLRTQWVKMVE